MTTFDTSKLKTFEDALDALDKLDSKKNPNADDADAHSVAEWIWKNCDHNDEEVVREVYIWANEDSELSLIAGEKYFELI